MEKRSEDGRHNTNRNVVVLDEKPCFGRYRTTTRKDFIYIFFGCCKKVVFCARFFLFCLLPRPYFFNPSSKAYFSRSVQRPDTFLIFVREREGRRWRCWQKKGLWWTGPTSVSNWRVMLRDKILRSWWKSRFAMTNSSLRVYQLNKTFQVLVFLLLFFDQSSCYWFDIATMKYSASAMFNSVLPPLTY